MGTDKTPINEERTIGMIADHRFESVQWYKSNGLDCAVARFRSNYRKIETLKLPILATSTACILALGLGACGPSKEEVALAKAEAATVQACEDSEAAIKEAGKGYEEGLNNVIALKEVLLDNIQGENPTDWREKYSNFSSQLVAVRQDFVINYGELREKYGNQCTNDSRRSEFNKTYVIPFNKRLVDLANQLHS